MRTILVENLYALTLVQVPDISTARISKLTGYENVRMDNVALENLRIISTLWGPSEWSLNKISKYTMDNVTMDNVVLENLYASGTLDVTGAATLGSTLDVAGKLTVTDNISAENVVTDNLYVYKVLTVDAAGDVVFNDLIGQADIDTDAVGSGEILANAVGNSELVDDIAVNSISKIGDNVTMDNVVIENLYITGTIGPPMVAAHVEAGENKVTTTAATNSYTMTATFSSAFTQVPIVVANVENIMSSGNIVGTEIKFRWNTTETVATFVIENTVVVTEGKDFFIKWIAFEPTI